MDPKRPGRQSTLVTDKMSSFSPSALSAHQSGKEYIVVMHTLQVQFDIIPHIEIKLRLVEAACLVRRSSVTCHVPMNDAVRHLCDLAAHWHSCGWNTPQHTMGKF